MPKLRSFIALPTNPEVRDRIAHIQNDLKSVPTDVKWEDSSKFHITLKFLGNTEVQLIQTLADELASHLHTIAPFDVEYQTLGCFPSIIRPRVVWIGTAPSQTLRQIQALTEETCARYGFAREDRAFHAHITLGRVKGNQNLDRLTEKIKNVTFEPFHARCSELHIMRSELHPSGSTYSLVKSIPLQS